MRFALVDCNNFYVSCERVFSPAARHRPVVVLSNNDGCIISRSEEAKRLGIPMGAPYFKWERSIQEKGVLVYSSNYPLYGNMSARVMTTLSGMTSHLQVYSIDEAFMTLAPGQEAAEIRSRVGQYTGIPTSIGIGPTKTLAKVANYVAKRRTEAAGVFELPEGRARERILMEIPAGAVWGIGRRWSRKLEAKGIRNALHLRDVNDAWIRRHMNIRALQTVQELRGIACITLERPALDHKSKICSRSFGKSVTLLSELREAVASYAALAAEKLRRDRLLTSRLSVFLSTGRHHVKERYHNRFEVILPVPTDYTPSIITHAHQALDRIFIDGLRYKKAGIALYGLQQASGRQGHLFADNPTSIQHSLMDVTDQLNRRYGRGAVFVASEGTRKAWAMRMEHRSLRATTQWSDLVGVQ